MTRRLTPAQTQLATDVLELSARRAGLIKQLAEIEGFQHQAMALAEKRGVRQKLLVILTELSPARVSQIVHATIPSAEVLSSQRRAWRHALDWPQDRLEALSGAQTPEQRATAKAKREAIHGSPGA